MSEDSIIVLFYRNGTKLYFNLMPLILLYNISYVEIYVENFNWKFVDVICLSRQACVFPLS